MHTLQIKFVQKTQVQSKLDGQIKPKLEKTSSWLIEGLEEMHPK